MRRSWNFGSWKTTFFVYVAVLHLALVSAAVGLLQCRAVALEGEMGPYYEVTVKHHLRLEGNAPDGVVLFFGDSRMQELYTQPIAALSANFGIGGDTILGLLQRIDRYESLSRSGAAVLAIGLNDLKYREAQEAAVLFSKVLSRIPPRNRVVVSAVLPIDESVGEASHGGMRSNQHIGELNDLMATACTADERCTFVPVPPELVDPAGGLPPDAHVGDGVHLSAEGAVVWGRALAAALSAAGAGRP